MLEKSFLVRFLKLILAQHVYKEKKSLVPKQLGQSKPKQIWTKKDMKNLDKFPENCLDWIKKCLMTLITN